MVIDDKGKSEIVEPSPVNLNQSSRSTDIPLNTTSNEQLEAYNMSNWEGSSIFLDTSITQRFGLFPEINNRNVLTERLMHYYDTNPNINYYNNN